MLPWLQYIKVGRIFNQYTLVNQFFIDMNNMHGVLKLLLLVSPTKPHYLNSCKYLQYLFANIYNMTNSS